ncbi:MAG: pyridoxamine 5'-phosphate oxidase family protein [Acidimicrobiaceae bacterium]|nr:pyridoxamine 5'-phosphate oxidase family protein [Acidimicrobiaceae bacterium]MYE08508.1 pyridoxamine 5'-phosphate oxidase family protein [Acidimicrobiaceae bacterium]MYI35132.1 pyridoxamine 5'-phosphate oxidase family protein [Acidimicrobiaceae bacterium]
MGTITDAVRREADRAVLCWLATVSADGIPNVSPKEIWRVHDDSTVVIAEIASPRSLRNLRHNSAACVSFVDVFRQRGFKLVGSVRVVGRADPDFGEMAGALVEIAGDKFKVRNALVLTVERVAPIVAPSYALHGATEDEMVAQSFRTYSVRPA